jgi:hypothetical protein
MNSLLAFAEACPNQMQHNWVDSTGAEQVEPDTRALLSGQKAARKVTLTIA